MTKERPMITYSIAQPYEVAVRKVRTALRRDGLRIAFELDVAARIRSELGAVVAPSSVLYVDDPAVLLEAIVFQRGAALLIPCPVVITGDNKRSDVIVRTTEGLSCAIPEGIRELTLDLLRRVSRTVASVCEKQMAELAS